MSPRALSWLAGITLIAVIAAGAAVMQRQSANQIDFEPQLLFPELKKGVDSIAKLSLRQGDDEIVVARAADGGWVMPDRGGWPANFETVRKAVLGMANLKAVERRTARAQNHAALQLGGPDAQTGAGMQLALYDSDDTQIAAIVIGKVKSPGSGTQPGTAYGRRLDEDQVYLIAGEITPSLDVSTWLDRALFDIRPERIMSLTVTPPVGRNFDIVRDSPEDEFEIAEIPEGKQPVLPDIARNLAHSIVLLTLEDVRQASDITMESPFISVHRMFDGMVLTTRAVQTDAGRWARFEASFDAAQADRARAAGLFDEYTRLPNADEARAMASAINKRTAGWAFKVTGMKATDMTRDYFSLFKTKSEEGAAPENPFAFPSR